MDRPLDIAFISEHASPAVALGSEDAGGQNVYVDELSRALGDMGHSVDIFTRRNCASAPDILNWAPGVRVVNLPVGPPEFISKDNLWLRMPEFLEAMCDFMSRQAVHYDLVHANFWMSGWAALQLRQQYSLPVVQTFHALGKTKQRFQGAADTSPSGRIAVELDIVREADRLIAQCPCERGELTRDYGAHLRKIAQIPAAVNAERFRPVPRGEARQRLGLPPDDFVIVYVGRVLPRKDIRNLVEAFALLRAMIGRQHAAEGQRARKRASIGHPLARLLIVGGETADPDPIATPEIGALQRLAEELGVRGLVQFAGRRQPDELRYFYSAADVAVTTPWYEPFGLTPLEAMACGRPVIGSAVGGIAFTVQDGVTGLLVPPRDPQALALRLYQLLIHAELRAAMGLAARQRVEREFTWDIAARRFAALYQSLVSEQRAPDEHPQPTTWERVVGEPLRW